MEWQLGVAMSSSSCRSLHCPYLTLQLKVADTTGRPQQQTVQMTLPEFQVKLKSNGGISDFFLFAFCLSV